MNVMSTNRNSRRLKWWIYEHASKHEMETALKHIIYDNDLNLETFDPNEISSILNPMFIFILLLKKFIVHMMPNKDCPIVPLGQHRPILQLILQLLETLYEKHPFISFTKFAQLITRLRLLDLFGLMVELASDEDILKQLNTYFPPLDDKSKKAYERQYHITDKRHKDNFFLTHSKLREFFLCLIMSKSNRDNYFTNEFSSDLKNHVYKATLIMNNIATYMLQQMPKSTIEKILDDSFIDEFERKDDPAIELIHMYIQDDNNETQVMNLLQSLHSVPDFRLSETLGTLSFMSEVLPESIPNSLDQHTQQMEMNLANHTKYFSFHISES